MWDTIFLNWPWLSKCQIALSHSIIVPCYYPLDRDLSRELSNGQGYPHFKQLNPGLIFYDLIKSDRKKQAFSRFVSTAFVRGCSFSLPKWQAVKMIFLAPCMKKLSQWMVFFSFFLQFYPDKNHGLRGGGTSDHLYHLLTRFLLEKLSISS